MTIFLKIHGASDLEESLKASCATLRRAGQSERTYILNEEVFSDIPGSPFAYWSSEELRSNFVELPAFESDKRIARVGLQTSDDFRFVRLWWECGNGRNSTKWKTFVRGGKASKYYGNIELILNWNNDGAELKAWASKVNHGKHWSRNIRSAEHYGRPGITWPLRAAALSPYPMPAGAIFSTRGTVAFEEEESLNSLMGLMASSAFDYLFKLLLGRFGHPEFSIGAVQRVPVPCFENTELGKLARDAWSLKRELASSNETSHAFVLPVPIHHKLAKESSEEIDEKLEGIQSKIDKIGFDIYGFSEEDQSSALAINHLEKSEESESGDDDLEEDFQVPVDDGLLSWAVGVAFGRFDWRLATGEREVPSEPEPFDPLPEKSPGMLPEMAKPFHSHSAILVDDEEHHLDLPRLISSVLDTVDAPIAQDISRWLRKDFFPFHLQLYSKSRRKAPIYWPLSTASGSYTLWLYYPELTNQTLFTAVNDFIEPKLNSVRDDLKSLRAKRGERSKQEEKELEWLENMDKELADLRDTLLTIAPSFRPDQDDGVQITASPLWSLFLNKPWQNILKDTWSRLRKGDYDWAHLALNYWPERVLRKCHEDRSLAIAHDVEDQFWEEVEVPVIRRGKDTGETKLEWQPRDLSESKLDALIERTIEERGL